MRGKNILFKRKLKVKTDCCEFQTDTTIPTDKWTQTNFSELYSILPDVINVLKEMQRYDDFVTVMKCIRERILTENIALHLLLDIGNFYSKDSINAVRYSNETLEFWLTVQKLVKGKGVNFFRGFKAQGLNTMNESLSSISPLDCRINFSVPSNPTLSKETSKYIWSFSISIDVRLQKITGNAKHNATCLLLLIGNERLGNMFLLPSSFVHLTHS